MADTILQGEKITKVFQQGKAETKVLDRIDIKIFEKILPLSWGRQEPESLRFYIV